MKQSRIPPGAKTWQSDVEAFHKMVEDEFYDILEETKERHNSTGVISPQVFNFPPVILDDFFEIFIDGKMKSGYHMGSSGEK